MKSVKSLLSPTPALAIFVVLTLLMLATRGHHFASLNHLPSASTAIFFIAGMYLRQVKAFCFFYLLTIALDLGASYYRGQFGDCLTVSYPALVFSYGLMFAGGYWTKPDWHQCNFALLLLKIVVSLFIVSSLAFLISNSSYYAFSGNFDPVSWAEYMARVERYYPNAITKPVLYVAIAVTIDFVVSRLLRQQRVISMLSTKL